MHTMRRLWNGDLSLPAAFWLGSVAVLVVVVFVLPLFLFSQGIAGASALAFTSFAVAILGCAYQALATVGVWRSAGRYSGPRLWGLLARSFSLLFLAMLTAQLAFVVYMFSVDSNDPSRSSANVASTLKRDPAFPFTGFWKSHCAQGFGLVIEPSGEMNTYAVSLCGPGGCFKPGTYRPNTTIVNDPSYKVVDANTLDIRSKDGFKRYSRCT